MNNSGIVEKSPIIGVSYGTAVAIGLIKSQKRVPMPTAQVLLGDSCLYSCEYCSVGTKQLARIKWYKVEYATLLKLLKKQIAKKSIKRICLQVTSSGISFSLCAVSDFISLGAKVSVSVRTLNESYVDKLISAGADTISIALDAVTPSIAEKIGRGDFHEHLDFLLKLSEKYPGKIATHIIIGFGETEKECSELLKLLHSHKIRVGLFAFTPVKGTKLAEYPRPSINHYRRVQVLNYLLNQSQAYAPNFNSKGELVGFSNVPELAFRTSGCDDCTRPFYDSSRKAMYNYHRRLSQNEYLQALKEARIYEASVVYKAGKLIKINFSHDYSSILSISVHGDFFIHPEEAIEVLEQSLVGCPLDKGSIVESVKAALSNAEVFGFSPEDIAQAILSSIA